MVRCIQFYKSNRKTPVKDGEWMEFSSNKLCGRIVEIFGSQRAFAKALGLSEHTISKKLNGYKDFTQSEIDKCLTLLKIPTKEIGAYFFTR